MIVSKRPILLKKSAMVSTAEKYAPEIEIFTLSRGFRANILRSCAQKRHFLQSVRAQPGRTGFFNTISHKPPLEGVYESWGDSLGEMHRAELEPLEHQLPSGFNGKFRVKDYLFDDVILI